MSQHLHLKYDGLTLHDLIDQLNTDYYRVVEQVSNDTLPGVIDFFQFRSNIMIPYVRELFVKVSTGHNCSTCSGKCDVQHKLKLIEFKGSIDEMKLKVSEAAPGGLPTWIDDLLYIEEHILIPGIIEAQKDINVHN